MKIASPPCIHIVAAPHGPVVDVVAMGRRFILSMEHRHVVAFNENKLSVAILEDGTPELVIVEPVTDEAKAAMHEKRYKVH